MKKNTKPKSKRGRKPEKVQISVRIDKAVMDLAYNQLEQTGVRITDLLERGLVLALREQGRMPETAMQARLFLQDAGVELQRRVVKMAALDRFEEVRPLSKLERCHRDFHLETIDAIEEWSNYGEVVKLLLQQPANREIEA